MAVHIGEGGDMATLEASTPADQGGWRIVIAGEADVAISQLAAHDQQAIGRTLTMPPRCTVVAAQILILHSSSLSERNELSAPSVLIDW